MKNKTIESRRKKRAKNEGNSKYARKIALQKRGVFSPQSPFRLTDGNGISLQELNKIRFESRTYLN